MKHRGRFINAVVLAIVLHHSAVAGVIHTPAPSTPPPPSSVTTEGDISTGATDQTETPSVAYDIHATAPASDSVIEVALSLVQSVLSLF